MSIAKVAIIIVIVAIIAILGTYLYYSTTLIHRTPTHITPVSPYKANRTAKGGGIGQVLKNVTGKATHVNRTITTSTLLNYTSLLGSYEGLKILNTNVSSRDISTLNNKISYVENITRRYKNIEIEIPIIKISASGFGTSIKLVIRNVTVGYSKPLNEAYIVIRGLSTNIVSPSTLTIVLKSIKGCIIKINKTTYKICQEYILKSGNKLRKTAYCRYVSTKNYLITRKLTYNITESILNILKKETNIKYIAVSIKGRPYICKCGYITSQVSKGPIIPVNVPTLRRYNATVCTCIPKSGMYPIVMIIQTYSTGHVRTIIAMEISSIVNYFNETLCRILSKLPVKSPISIIPAG